MNTAERTLILTKSGGYCVYRAAPIQAGNRIEYAVFPEKGETISGDEIAEVIKNETARGSVIVDERP
jgi:hypothetical protein